MELRDLNYYVDLVNTKNFQKTAQNFGVTTPAISAMVKRLESELNTKLIYKASNRSVLTVSSAGEVLFKQAKKMLKLEENTKHLVKRAGENNFRLGFSELAGKTWLAPIMRHLSEEKLIRYVETRQESSPFLVNHLLSGRYDAIIYSELADEKFDNLHGDVLKTYDLKIFMNKDYPLAQNDVIDFRDLRRETFITYHKRFLGREGLKIASRKAGIKLLPSQLLVVDNVDAIEQLVIDGVGIAYLPDSSLSYPDSLAVRPVVETQREKILLKLGMREDFIPNDLQKKCIQVLKRI